MKLGTIIAVAMTGSVLAVTAALADEAADIAQADEAADIAQADEATLLDEITVTGTREGEKRSETPSSVDVMGGESLREVKASHPGEVMGRTVDYSGKDMEAAPRTMINATLAYRPSALPGTTIELETVVMGGYVMDGAYTDTVNEHRYKGHHLFNVRAAYDLTDKVRLFGRVNNLTDRRYATSASYNSFRGEELAPGMPLSAYAGIEAKF